MNLYKATIPFSDNHTEEFFSILNEESTKLNAYDLLVPTALMDILQFYQGLRQLTEILFTLLEAEMEPTV